jgi:CDP-paratose synthetase
MKILVTGATGFLGSHLTKSLVNEGYEVIVLKRSFSNTWRISEVLAQLKVYDIDKYSIKQIFQECKSIDVIIHTATEYDRNGESYIQLLSSNVSFPLELLETAILYNTKLFINTDSFIHKKNYCSTHLAGYALTKQQFLQWMKVYTSFEKIKLINLKLEHVYGPFDNQNKFFPFILKNCLNNVPELNLTLGNQKRDFIHISDVVSAYLIILKQKNEINYYFKEYEVGRGSSESVRKFVELIHEKTNSKTLLRFGAVPLHENEIMESKANSVELKKLGWNSLISIEKGIELTIADDKG